MAVGKSLYIVKQSKGAALNFSYMEGAGIFCRMLRHNEWSKPRLLIRNARRNFAVVQLESKDIYIVHEDEDGNVFISLYGGRETSRALIYKDEKNDSTGLYLKAVGTQDKIHVFYAVRNDKKNTIMIYHQEIDEKMNVSPINIVGSTSFDYSQPFIVHCSESGKLYVMYQRFADSHCLGYKLFKAEEGMWSKFFEVNKGDNPYGDFSLIEVGDTLHFSFIKKEGSSDVLIYGWKSDANTMLQEIASGEGIMTCSVYKIKEHMWCSWETKEALLSVMSPVSSICFNNRPHEVRLNQSDVVKAPCLHRYDESIKDLCFDEVYVNPGKRLRYLTVYNIFDSYKVQYGYLTYIQECLTGICEKLYSNRFAVETTEKFIEPEVDDYEFEENTLTPAQVRIKEMRELVEKFESCRESLNSGIELLQNRLEDRNTKIAELESIIKEREEQIDILRSELDPGSDDSEEEEG